MCQRVLKFQSDNITVVGLRYAVIKKLTRPKKVIFASGLLPLFLPLATHPGDYMWHQAIYKSVLRPLSF